MPRASVLKMFRTQALRSRGKLFVLLFGAQALAAAEDGSQAASDAQGRIVYMVLPEDRHETFWSNPPEFEATGDIAPMVYASSNDALLVRVYPRTVGALGVAGLHSQLEPALYAPRSEVGFARDTGNRVES